MAGGRRGDLLTAVQPPVRVHQWASLESCAADPAFSGSLRCAYKGRRAAISVSGVGLEWDAAWAGNRRPSDVFAGRGPVPGLPSKQPTARLPDPPGCCPSDRAGHRSAPKRTALRVGSAAVRVRQPDLPDSQHPLSAGARHHGRHGPAWQGCLSQRGRPFRTRPVAAFRGVPHCGGSRRVACSPRSAGKQTGVLARVRRGRVPWAQRVRPNSLLGPILLRSGPFHGPCCGYLPGGGWIRLPGRQAGRRFARCRNGLVAHGSSGQPAANLRTRGLGSGTGSCPWGRGFRADWGRPAPYPGADRGNRGRPRDLP